MNNKPYEYLEIFGLTQWRRLDIEADHQEHVFRTQNAVFLRIDVE